MAKWISVLVLIAAFSIAGIGESLFPVESVPAVLAMTFFAPVLLLVNGIMSLRYGRTGISFFLVLIAAIYLLYVLPGDFFVDPQLEARMRDGILLVAPLLLAYFALSGDKGLVSGRGAIGAVLIVLGAAVVSLWTLSVPIRPWVRTLRELFVDQTPEPVLDFLQGRGIPPFFAVYVSAWALVLFVAGFAKRRDGAWMLPWPFVLLSFCLGIGMLGNPGALLYWICFDLLIFLFVLIHLGWRFAFIDDLTGVPNRRSLEQTLDRLGGNYTIAMADVDHFKSFNDKFGHETGDQVLRMTASKLQGPRLRVFRYGGEEFTLIFKGEGRDAAYQELEAARRRVEQAVFVVRSRKRAQKITISIGAVPGSGSGKQARDLLQKADAALYQAKQRGRNCVVY